MIIETINFRKSLSFLVRIVYGYYCSGLVAILQPSPARSTRERETGGGNLFPPIDAASTGGRTHTHTRDPRAVPMRMRWRSRPAANLAGCCDEQLGQTHETSTTDRAGLRWAGIRTGRRKNGHENPRDPPDGGLLACSERPTNERIVVCRVVITFPIDAASRAEESARLRATTVIGSSPLVSFKIFFSRPLISDSGRRGAMGSREREREREIPATVGRTLAAFVIIIAVEGAAGLCIRHHLRHRFLPRAPKHPRWFHLFPDRSAPWLT